MTPRRRRVLAILVCLVALIVSALAAERELIFNSTSSLPKGFYRLRKQTSFQVGDQIYFRPSDSILQILYERQYVPQGGELMKPVVATEGTPYCVTDEAFTVDDRPVGPVFSLDSAGRPIPQHERGCFEVPDGHVLVGSSYHPRSFDSRYFGPIPTTSIHGTTEKLWTW